MSDSAAPHLILRTVQQDDSGTFAQLILGETVLAFTCELPWKDNEPEVSCIPAGTYDCIPHDSLKHPQTWEITGVPGRSEILIHIGNTTKDTLGCVLVGTMFLRGPGLKCIGVAHSVDAMNILRHKLPENFTLTVERLS